MIKAKHKSCIFHFEKQIYILGYCICVALWERDRDHTKDPVCYKGKSWKFYVSTTLKRLISTNKRRTCQSGTCYLLFERWRAMFVCNFSSLSALLCCISNVNQDQSISDDASLEQIRFKVTIIHFWLHFFSLSLSLPPSVFFLFLLPILILFKILVVLPWAKMS